tara:strand:+ start:434 stop:799 length:366 start_codon:yes stop_codon:yes gene_type:complete
MDERPIIMSRIDKDIYNAPTVEESIKSAKNDSDMDLGIAIDQAFDEAVKNGFKGSKIDFIKSAPIKLLRTFLAKGGPVKEIDDNSLQQLIDDYLDDIRTMKDGKKMSLTDYIKENGGVKSE